MPGSRPSIRDTVMASIHAGQVRMRPKWYFLLGAILLGAGLGALLLVALYGVAVTAWHLRGIGVANLLEIGREGVGATLELLPWLPLGVALLGLVGGLLLLRRYDVSYKVGMLGLTLGLLSLVVTAGLLLDRDALHHRAKSVGLVRSLYRERTEGQHFVVGKVVAAQSDRLVLELPSGQQVTVLLDSQTRLIRVPERTVGIQVRVLGQPSDGQLRAHRVLPVPRKINLRLQIRRPPTQTGVGPHGSRES